jgi:hypothetical protein
MLRSACSVALETYHGTSTIILNVKIKIYNNVILPVVVYGYKTVRNEHRLRGFENRVLREPRNTLYQQKLALTSPTSGRRSVGIFHSRTKDTEFFLGVLRRIFRPKRNKVAGGGRGLHNGELRNLHCSPSIIRMIKSRRTRWAGYVA